MAETDENEEANFGFKPVLEFDNQGRDFSRGFEAGRVWGALRENPEARSETVHSDNAEMFMRICEAEGRSFSATETGPASEGVVWMDIEIGERPSEETD